MDPLDLVAFAGRAVLGHRLRSLLALVGVSIGVASVIILTSLGEGARLYVVNEFAELGTNLIVVFPGRVETSGFPMAGGVPNDLTLDDAEALRKGISQVRWVAPLSMGEANAEFGDRQRRVTVIGTTTELLHIRHLKVHVGRFLPAGEPLHAPRVATIGAKVQRELFGDRNPLGEILHIGGERFRVIGVIAPRGMSLGLNLDEVVDVPVVHCMRMFDQRSLFRILVHVGSREEIPAVREAIRRILTERHGEEDITVLTEDAVLGTLDSILGVLTAALGGIAAISLLVAGVAIMNVMLVSVSERTSEVGLLKAVGVTPRQVVAVFLVEAAALSTAGGVAGLAGGYATVFVLQRVWPTFPVHPPTWAVVAAVVTSVAVGLAFGVLPARRAAALDPVAALQRR
jgi:putative ABC transport system permease protein